MDSQKEKLKNSFIYWCMEAGCVVSGAGLYLDMIGYEGTKFIYMSLPNGSETLMSRMGFVRLDTYKDLYIGPGYLVLALDIKSNIVVELHRDPNMFRIFNNDLSMKLPHTRVKVLDKPKTCQCDKANKEQCESCKPELEAIPIVKDEDMSVYISEDIGDELTLVPDGTRDNQYKYLWLGPDIVLGSLQNYLKAGLDISRNTIVELMRYVNTDPEAQYLTQFLDEDSNIWDTAALKQHLIEAPLLAGWA